MHVWSGGRITRNEVSYVCDCYHGISYLVPGTRVCDTRERELAIFEENRRAVGMLNEPYARQENKGTYRGEKGGRTPVTTAFPEAPRGENLLRVRLESKSDVEIKNKKYVRVRHFFGLYKAVLTLFLLPGR